MRPEAVRLQIDRLVLEGFSPLDAQRVRDAFAATLADRLAAADAGGAAPAERLRLSVPAGSDPAALGRAAALALIEGWQR